MAVTNIEYYIDGTQVSPLGWEKIGLQADLKTDFADLELTESTLDFEHEDKTLIQSILLSKGYNVAVPMTVIVPSNDATIAPIQVNFMLKTVGSLEESDTLLRMGVERRYGLNRFWDRANGITWDDINDKTPITGATAFAYREVNPTPASELVTLSIQAGASLIGLYDSTTGIALAISAAVGGISGAAETALALAIEAGRAVLLGVSLSNTGKQIFRIYFPKQKYFWEAKNRDLIRQACEYLGYTLSSSLLDEYANAGTIAVPILEQNKSSLENLFDDVNYRNPRYPKSQDGVISNVGGFIMAEKERLNAEIQIVDQTLFFERESFFAANPVELIKETLTEQEILENLTTYEYENMWSHKLIGYQTDSADRWTFDKTEGLTTEYRTIYTGTADEDLVDINGYENITFPWALARRKEKLSYMDEQAIIFGTVVDSITNALSFGNGTNLVQQVQGSIGQMMISDKTFTKPKLVWAVGSKQTPDFIDRIGADAIYQANHTNNQVKEGFKGIKKMTVPFSVENFRNIITGRYIQNQNNTTLKVYEYSWIPGDGIINITTAQDEASKCLTETEKVN